MTCEKYRELTTAQQVIMVGQIVHAMQNNNDIFDLVSSLITLAAAKGIYDHVTILPQTQLTPIHDHDQD